MAKYLVVAHQTSESEELLEAIERIAAENPGAEFVLLVPATPVEHLTGWTEGESKSVARSQADAASQRLTAGGVKVVAAAVGDPDPFTAVMDALNLDAYDGIVLSTLPAGISRWLRRDLVKRVEAAFPLPVVHVVAGS